MSEEALQIAVKRREVERQRRKGKIYPFECRVLTNYPTIALISHASKVMLKIIQVRLQQYMNFQIFKLELEKAGEQEIKLPTSVGFSKKQENSRKTSTSAL